MEGLVVSLISAMRFVLPVAAIIIILTCVISLFRNRPRVHKMAQLRRAGSGELIEINHWETSIGKSKANDISLDETGVARFHAVIAKKRSDWVVTDTFSRTGVIVNGNQIEGKAVIEDGDIIEIGAVKFKFECAEALSAATKKQIRRSAQNAQPAPAAAGRNVAYAVLVDAATRKPVYLRKNDVLIGRGENCDIKIMSDKISSEHARIYKTTRGFALADLDSHNGTKLNGRFINQTRLIFDEDTITFGDRVFVFYEK